ncbi:MAG: PorT family protein [Flavobacteriales bacterium]|nr:PorT family protein [Flavobacteriales bacterium]
MIIFIYLIALCPLLYGQTPQNLAGFYNKPYYFGMSLGGNTASFSLKHNNLNSRDTLLTLNPKSSAGFNIHIVSELRLSDFVSLRFTPGLTFTDRELIYRFNYHKNNQTLTRFVESNYIDAPLLLKFRSQRAGNFAMNANIGPKYSYNLISPADNTGSNLKSIEINTLRHQFLGNIGVGMDFFLQYFKFGFEMNYSFGLHNILIQDHTLLSEPIDFIRPKIFLLCLTVEG